MKNWTGEISNICGTIGLVAAVILASIAGVAMTSCTQGSEMPDKSVGPTVAKISVQISLEQLVTQSDLIISGRVVGMESFNNEDKSDIYTLVTVSVDEWLKGRSGPPMLLIRVPGGEVGGMVQVVEDTAKFTEDENVLVFLRTSAEGDNLVVGGIQGKYSIENGKAVGVVPSINGMDIQQLKNEIASLS